MENEWPADIRTYHRENEKISKMVNNEGQYLGITRLSLLLKRWLTRIQRRNERWTDIYRQDYFIQFHKETIFFFFFPSLKIHILFNHDNLWSGIEVTNKFQSHLKSFVRLSY